MDGRAARRGLSEVENTGLQDGREAPFDARMRWPRRQWRSLLFALAVSLGAHVIVLSSVHTPPQRVGDARAPVLVVTIARPVVASPAPLPQAQRAAPAAPAMSRQRAAKENALAAAPKRADAQAVAKAAPRASAPTPPRLQPAEKERAFEAADTLDAPPTPLSSPEFGDVAARVEGRRLQANVWVDEQGVVRKAFVKRNEISDEVAARLEQAIAAVHFAPGRKDGRAVPAVLDARLCFDDAGVLDTRSDECLRPAAAPQDGEPAAR